MSGKKLLWIAVVLAFVAGCAGPSPPSPEPPADATAIPPTASPQLSLTPLAEATASPAARPAPPLLSQQGELFSAAGACATCHTGMVDESGTDVSIDAFWRSTMMANAARDPYWQASVRAEVMEHPELEAVIEDKCSTCHMPMARFTEVSAGGEPAVLDDGYMDPQHPYHELAMDGVSCTICHQIQETNLGQPESFSGGYEIDTGTLPGERSAFGPYPVGQARADIMQSVSGFIPVESAHLGRPELCATCHTLYTPFVDSEGQIAGEFPEQMAYLEWGHSTVQEAQTCQDCHMPVAEGAIQISTTGGPPRSPFRKHVFVGGNVHMLRILDAFGDQQQVTAGSEHFEGTIGRATDQLQNRSATLDVERAARSGSQLSFEVVVRNQAGHKLPTGFPARRAWLHVAIQDTEGNLLFESGAVRADGSIEGNENDADETAYEPHYIEISRSDQVQIYEPILANAEGEVTTTLLRAATYLKDNRLLPAGFDKETAGEDIAVYGAAADDADFSGGEDRVRYALDLGQATGPFEVTVELWYQAIGFRWAQKLSPVEAAEAERFQDYYEAVTNAPLTLARASLEVE